MNSKSDLVKIESGETADVSRALLIWLNTWPDKPVKKIGFEALGSDEPSMALSTIQGVYKSKKYILGGYQATYQFKVIYRVQPSDSDNKRLLADEILNRLAEWMTQNAHDLLLSGNRTIQRIDCNAASTMFGRYENGDEDHQILMTLIYEVV